MGPGWAGIWPGPFPKGPYCPRRMSWWLGLGGGDGGQEVSGLGGVVRYSRAIRCIASSSRSMVRAVNGAAMSRVSVIATVHILGRSARQSLAAVRSQAEPGTEEGNVYLVGIFTTVSHGTLLPISYVPIRISAPVERFT